MNETNKQPERETVSFSDWLGFMVECKDSEENKLLDWLGLNSWQVRKSGKYVTITKGLLNVCSKSFRGSLEEIMKRETETLYKEAAQCSQQ